MITEFDIQIWEFIKNFFKDNLPIIILIGGFIFWLALSYVVVLIAIEFVKDQAESFKKWWRKP